MDAPRGLLVIRQDGTIENPSLPADPDENLAALQRLVEGMIEPVDLGADDVEGLVNGDSLYVWPEPNLVASAVSVTFAGGGYLHGPVVFTGGVGEAGHMIGLSEEKLAELSALATLAAAEIATVGPHVPALVMDSPQFLRTRSEVHAARMDALSAVFGDRVIDAHGDLP